MGICGVGSELVRIGRVEVVRRWERVGGPIGFGRGDAESGVDVGEGEEMLFDLDFEVEASLRNDAVAGG